MFVNDPYVQFRGHLILLNTVSSVNVIGTVLRCLSSTFGFVTFEPWKIDIIIMRQKNT